MPTGAAVRRVRFVFDPRPQAAIECVQVALIRLGQRGEERRPDGLTPAFHLAFGESRQMLMRSLRDRQRGELFLSLSGRAVSRTAPHAFTFPPLPTVHCEGQWKAFPSRCNPLPRVFPFPYTAKGIGSFGATGTDGTGKHYACFG